MNRCILYDMDCDTATLSNKRKMTFELDGKEIEFYHADFSEDKVLLVQDDGTVLIGYFK